MSKCWLSRQLTHPLVSPILQGSLGNLCPLYILAGDGEVLRDEIVYMAHKAANPKEYPTRKGVLREAVRQKENAEKFQKPTKVRSGPSIFWQVMTHSHEPCLIGSPASLRWCVWQARG